MKVVRNITINILGQKMIYMKKICEEERDIRWSEEFRGSGYECNE